MTSDPGPAVRPAPEQGGADPWASARAWLDAYAAGGYLAPPSLEPVRASMPQGTATLERDGLRISLHRAGTSGTDADFLVTVERPPLAVRPGAGP